MNVGHLLTRAAQRYPNSPAWVQGDNSIPFWQAEGRVNRLANTLIALGGRPGHRVGMLLPNCYQGLETILAPMKVRMSVVPMNVKLTPQEHQYLLNNSETFTLIYSEEFKSHLDEIRTDLNTVKHFVCLGNNAEGDLNYEELVESASPNPPDITIDPDDLAWIFYTSGTTGQPKGAMLTHRNLMTMVDNFLLDINPATPNDVLLHAAPITHGSGLSMFHQLARGGANAFPNTRSFDPLRIFSAIQQHRVTTMFLAPTMVNMLVANPGKESYDLSSLHTIIYGGGPMYTEHLLEAMRTFGPIFVQLFGLGEAPMTITSLPKEEHLANWKDKRLERLGSVGREVTGVRIRVVDEHDQDVPTGSSGEIIVRSDLVMKGYLNNPEATAETLRGGWLHTGDLGYLNTEGYLYITDRIKDLIISGGANIYPREVEEVIAKHPSVAEVSVIGVPDTKWGEAVKALIVLRPGIQETSKKIIEFCRANLASYKKPQSVEFLPTLPKNAYGKVLKRQLRELYWKGYQRRV